MPTPNDRGPHRPRTNIQYHVENGWVVPDQPPPPRRTPTQEQRRAAARQRGQPAPVGAAPARKFFHKAKLPLVFVPLYKEPGPAVKKRALPFCRGQTYLFLALLPKKRYNTIEYL